MKFAVLDFETTGDQPGRDDIIQVGLVIINDFKIEHTYASLVKPNGPIPPFIHALTGISDDMVADAPELEDVVNDIVPLLAESVLVAHHAAFDLGFLQHALTSCGYSAFDGRVLDTLDWLRILFPTLTSYQLSFVSEALSVPHDRPHQADSDAEATAHIWVLCLQKLFELPLITLQRLSFLLAHPDFSQTDIAWFLSEALDWKERQPVADTGHRLVRQFALGVEEWSSAEKGEERSVEPFSLDFDSFREQVTARLRQRLTEYEARPAQERMMREVSQALMDEKHLVIEAGTGTGKSLGYLLPSVHFALTNREKVVVSTHTINLQEQLRQKELPLLQEVLPVPFRAAVLKGRSHYLCLRKFEGKINGQDFVNERDDRLIAAQMIVWLGETKEGDDEELNLGGKGGDFWSDVASDADSCLNRACPWFRNCFYHRARNEANEADIVVTNHSLLFTDVAAEHRILPPYGRLVVDEAHHFEEVASHHLGVEVSYFTMVGSLTALLKDSRTGQLPLLHALVDQCGNQKLEGWGERITNLYPQIVRVKEMWDELFEALYAKFGSRPSDPGEAGLTVRFKSEQLPQGWDTFTVMEDNIYIAATEILKVLERLVGEGKEEADDYSLESLFTNLNGTVKDLSRARDALRFIIKANDKNNVYWMEANPNFKSKSIRLYAAPIDVSSLLRAHFWERKEAVVLTSATLTVEKSFQYVKDQLGLDAADESEERIATVQLPSPFSFREQALVMIPRDFPGLKGANAEPDFIARLVESLRDAAAVTGGKMLVLFTSHKMLKQTHAPLKEALQPYGIHVLGQGVDSGNRSKLTRLFMQARSAVLLGTSSFWEGVDLPGDALTCLAIVRLPFQPPNHPIVEAKSEFLKSRKQNPFTKLSIPQAVIRFKQGFGRLVRTARDRGVVIIYDTRVIETSYGKHFLYSLPGPKIEHLPSDAMPVRIREWLEASETVVKEAFI